MEIQKIQTFNCLQQSPDDLRRFAGSAALLGVAFLAKDREMTQWLAGVCSDNIGAYMRAHIGASKIGTYLGARFFSNRESSPGAVVSSQAAHEFVLGG